MLLNNKRIAILVEADYQDLELHYPRLRLIEEGAEILIVGSGAARRFTGKYGYPVDVTHDAGLVDAGVLDGVIIPGGWAPDRIRQYPAMVDLVRTLMRSGKTVGCICHGGWVLASAGVVEGRRLTSYIAIRDDLVNAGADWVDEEVVVDGNLITSRKPDDLPAFMRAVIASLQR